MRALPLLIAACFVFPTICRADDCAGVIALSRNKAQKISSQEEIKSNASNFCSSYHQYKSSGDSKSFGASYKFLSATMAKSSSSVDDVASKYCSASSEYSQYNGDYSSYVDEIAPGAMEAYTACVNSQSGGVHFRVREESILPTEFIMFVGYDKAGPPGLFTVSPSAGVQCKWDGEEKSGVKELVPPHQAAIHCQRANSATKAFVAISMSTGMDNFIMPWPGYTPEGVAIDLVAALRKDVDDEIGVMRANNAATLASLRTKAHKDCDWNSDYQGDCVATCATGLAIGGSCQIGNTFGDQVALSDTWFEGANWHCHDLDHSHWGQAGVPQPPLKLKADAVCLTVPK